MAYFKCNGNMFRAYIDITSTANATVTATSGVRSYTAQCNGSGYARILVRQKGSYNITSTGTTRVGHATIVDSTPVTAYYIWGKYTIDSQYVSYTASTGVVFATLYSYSYSAPLSLAWGHYLDQANCRFVLSSPWTTTSTGEVHDSLRNNPGGVRICTTAINNDSVGPNYTGWDGTRNHYGSFGPTVTWANSGASTSYNSRNDWIKTFYGTTLGITTQQIRGNYVSNVTSTSLNGYPNNGISGSNWYVAA